MNLISFYEITLKNGKDFWGLLEIIFILSLKTGELAPVQKSTGVFKYIEK